MARVGLSAIAAFLAGILACAWSTPLREIISATLGWNNPEKAQPAVLVLFCIGLVFLAGLLSWFGRRWSWRALAVAGAPLLAVLAWLAWDEPVARRPLTFEQMFPAFPGDQASYAVLIRYGKLHPAARGFKGSNMNWISNEKPEEWVAFVTKHRAEIEAEWEQLAPARAWWDELDRFERIADLMPARPDGELLAFAPVRMLAQRTCAIATLRALDGRGDEAMDLLVALVGVSRKLQLTGRSLVIQMISIITERMAMHTVGFVLDRAPVSPAACARLAAVLSAPGGGEAGARRLVTVEYVITAGYFTQLPLGDLAAGFERVGPFQRVLNGIDPFIYNRRATLNLAAAFGVELEELVGRRELEQLEARQKQFLGREARPGFKNIGGKMLLREIYVPYGKVAGSYWKTQDQRAVLLARLQAEAAAAK
jgi:hypothetical protein